MRNTGQHLNINGTLFALCEHDGHYFVYDPRQEIDSPTRASGLGAVDVEKLAITAGSKALDFVPVVGPILSTLATSLFGSGDPTPIREIAMQAVTDRIALAAARNSHGIADAFDVAKIMAQYGADPSDQANAGPMVAQEILGRPIQPFDTARHNIKRDDYKAAIAQMENATRALMAMPSTQLPVYAPASFTTGSASTGVLTSQNTSLLPWILPAAALAAYLLVG